MKVFDMNSPMGRFFGNAFDIALVNLLFILTCLPVVTIGASITAMYKVMLAMAKDEEGPIVSYYWKGFKENLAKATFFWLSLSAVMLLLIVEFYYYFVGYLITMRSFMMIMLGIGMFIVCMIGEWIFVWQARFINTKKEIFHNARLFVIRYLPANIFLTAVTIVWTYVVIFFPQTWIFTIFFGFSLPAYIKSMYYRVKLQPFEDIALKKGGRLWTKKESEQ